MTKLYIVSRNEEKRPSVQRPSNGSDQRWTPTKIVKKPKSAKDLLGNAVLRQPKHRKKLLKDVDRFKQKYIFPKLQESQLSYIAALDHVLTFCRAFYSLSKSEKAKAVRALSLSKRKNANMVAEIAKLFIDYESPAGPRRIDASRLARDAGVIEWALTKKSGLETIRTVRGLTLEDMYERAKARRKEQREAEGLAAPGRKRRTGSASGSGSGSGEERSAGLGTRSSSDRQREPRPTSTPAKKDRVRLKFSKRVPMDVFVDQCTTETDVLLVGRYNPQTKRIRVKRALKAGYFKLSADKMDEILKVMADQNLVGREIRAPRKGSKGEARAKKRAA